MALIHHFKFEDDVTDEVGGSWSLTAIGSPTYTASGAPFKDKAIDFNGSSQYARKQDVSLNGLAAITISMWVYPDALFGAMYAITNTWLSSNTQLHLRAEADGTIEFRLRASSTTTTKTTAAGTLIAGRWNYIVAVYNNPAMDIWVDSTTDQSNLVKVLNDTHQTGGTIGVASGPQDFMIGCRYGGTHDVPTNYYNGKFDDFRIYDTALTSTEMEGIRDEGGPTFSIISLDSLIRNTLFGTLSADAYLQDTITASVSLDALIEQVATVAIDAYVQGTVTNILSLDALVRDTFTSALSLHGYIQDTIEATASLDSLIQQGKTGTASLDALLFVSVAADPPGQILYECILTGAPDATTDLTLPISSFQHRHRSGAPSYLSVTVPASAQYAAGFAARPNGELVITRRIVNPLDGSEISSNEIARSAFETLRTDQGSSSESATLSGNKTTSNTTQQIVALTGASYKAVSNGLRRYRCQVNNSIRAGDYALINGEQFLVDEIVYTVTPVLATMEVQE